MKTRRFFLGATASSAFVAPLAMKAYARGRGGDPNVLTTLTIVNTSGGSVAEGSVTQLIGCPFKKGDISKGTWPQFQLKDGTQVPCTLLSALATTWSDGSLKFVPAMLQIPVAIKGNGQLTINVLSGGWLPQPSPRSLADFQNGISPQVQVDGLDNLQGTWVMDLGSVAGKNKGTLYGNGAAGAIWKVRAKAKQHGSRHHPQLVCDFYVASLANPDGSLKGLRILGKVKLPYYDTTATMNWVSFSRFQLCRDSSGGLIRDCFGSNFGDTRAYQFSWLSGATFQANHGYRTDNYGDYDYCTRLSTTGTLPAGLSANTSYFCATLSSSTIGFGTNSRVPYSTLVSAMDGGTGTHTATPYPYLAYFGALFTAGPTGMWDFVQGAGTDNSDTPLRCQMNPKYWVSTRLTPSYDITVKPTSNNPTTYWPNSSEPVCRAISNTGERDDLGIMPAWYARHFLTQAAVDEQVVRVVSLVGGQLSIGFESEQTKSLPCVNNGPNNSGQAYHGMPAPNPQLLWVPGVPSQGFQDTTNQNVLIAGFSAQSTDHMPQFNYYPYLFTGEPWHLDMLLEHANNAILSRYAPLAVANISSSEYYIPGGRNLQVPPNAATYGNAVGADETRTSAWAGALIGAAAGICPDAHPDCRSYKQYFGDLNSNNWTAAINIYKALPKYASKNGLWHVVTGPFPYIDHWQMAYYGAAIALASSTTEDKHARLALSALVQWFNHVVTNFGGWHAGAYMTIIKTGADDTSPLVLSDADVAFHGPTLGWTAGGRFTLVPFSNYTPVNGDKFIFADGMGGLGQVTPAGFSKYTPYYMVNLSGSQFDLASTPSGLPLPVTDSYSGDDRFFMVSTSPPPTGSMSLIGDAVSYTSEVLGMLNYALAAGAAVQSQTVTDLTYRIQQAGTDFTSNPKWAMVGNFVE